MRATSAGKGAERECSGHEAEPYTHVLDIFTPHSSSSSLGTSCLVAHSQESLLHEFLLLPIWLYPPLSSSPSSMRKETPSCQLFEEKGPAQEGKAKTQDRDGADLEEQESEPALHQAMHFHRRAPSRLLPFPPQEGGKLAPPRPTHFHSELSPPPPPCLERSTLGILNKDIREPEQEWIINHPLRCQAPPPIHTPLGSRKHSLAQAQLWAFWREPLPGSAAFWAAFFSGTELSGASK